MTNLVKISILTTFMALLVLPISAQIPSGYVQTTATVPTLAGGSFGAAWTNLSSSPQLGLLGCVSTFQNTVNGSIDSYGHFSTLLADTAQICPTPSTWTFTLSCPAASPGAFQIQVAITGGGGTEDISSQITAALPAGICSGGGGGTLPIMKGGTGSSTAAGALANLGGAALSGAAFTGPISAPQSQSTPYTTTLSFPLTLVNGTANQKVDLYLPANASFVGEILVSLTDTFSIGDNYGSVKKLISAVASNAGSIYGQVTRYVEASGGIAATYAINDLAWDSGNSRWKITISCLIAGYCNTNTLVANVAALSDSTTVIANVSAMKASAVYTTDSTVYPTPTVSYPGAVSAPALNGVLNAASYPGATADVKLNACLTAALPAGTCDIRGWGGTTQNIAATVTIPGAVTLLGDYGEKFQPSSGFIGQSVTAATYVSGGTFSGTGNVTLGSFNNSCSGVTATMAVSSGAVSLGSINITNGGTSCAGAPTTAICTSDTATCSGTVTLNSLGAPMFAPSPNAKIHGVLVDLTSLTTNTWTGTVLAFNGFYTTSQMTDVSDVLVTASNQNTGRGISITGSAVNQAYTISLSHVVIFGTNNPIYFGTAAGSPGYVNSVTADHISIQPATGGNGIVMNALTGEIAGNIFNTCNIEGGLNGVLFEGPATITTNQFQCNMWDQDGNSFYNAGVTGASGDNTFTGELDKPSYDPAGLNSITNLSGGTASTDATSKTFTNPPVIFNTTLAANDTAIRINSSDTASPTYWTIGANYQETNSDLDFCFNGEVASACPFAIDNAGNYWHYEVKFIPSTISGYQGPAAGYVQLAPAPSTGCFQYTGSAYTWGSCGGTGTMTWPTFTGLAAYGGASNWVNPTYSMIVALFGSGSCSGYLKSDGTCSTPGGTGFNGGAGTSFQDALEIAAPANPASTYDRLYLDSTAHQLKCLTSSGGSCMPSGSGTVTTSGSPVSPNIAAFSSSTAITAATSANIQTAIGASVYDAYGAAAARQANLSLLAGTYVNGDMCTYTASGTLLNCNTAPYSLPGTVVQTNQANTYTTGLQDFIAATMKLPSSVTVGANYINFPASSGTLALTSQLPSVGTWGALNYPTWVSGIPFVKMTAAGTFSLDTNTYLTTATAASTYAPIFTLTTTGSSGAATYSGNVLNIPQYAGGGSMTWPSAAGIAVYGGSSAWGTSLTAPAGTIVGTTDTQTLINKTLDGVTPTTMGYVDPTSSIQTQLNAKGTGTVTHTGNLTALQLMLGNGTADSKVDTIALSDGAGNLTVASLTVSGSAHGITIPAGTAVSGAAGSAIYASDSTNGYAEVNENNTGLSRVCTAANGICPSYSLPGTVVQTNQANTYSTGLQNFSSASMKLPLTATESGGNTLTFPTATGTVALTSAIPAAQVAANLASSGSTGVTGILPGANGGTGATTAAGALANLGAVSTATTVNGHALSSNVTVSASDLTTGTLPHAQLPTLLSGDIPNNAANTSGNAATATALASAPTTCTTGNAPTGILANGNATGCAAIGGSGVSSINSNVGAFTFNGAGVSCAGTTCTFTGGTGSGTVQSGTAYSPTYYPSGGGAVVAGVTPFTGLAWYTTSAAPAQATSANVQTAIGASVYDAYGAAAARQVNLNLLAGTYVNGDMCTYTASGTLLNCNTAIPTSFPGFGTTSGTAAQGNDSRIVNAAQCTAGTSAGNCLTLNGSGLVPAANLPAQYKTWSCQPGLGDGLNAITAGTYLQTVCKNTTGVSVTLTGLSCYVDGGTSSTMNASGNTLGALLTGPVTCSTSFAAGTQSANVTLTNGDYIKFTFVADGTAKQSTWVITGTY